MHRASHAETAPCRRPPHLRLAALRKASKDKARSLRKATSVARFPLPRAQVLWLGWHARAGFKAGIVVAAFFNCIIFPALLAFGAAGTHVGAVTFGSGWATLFVCLDVFLWVDIAATFVTPGFTAHGEVVASHAAVASAYLRGHFALDFLSRFPWSFVLPANCAGHSVCLSYAHLARLALLPRAFDVGFRRIEGGARDLHARHQLGLLCLRALVHLHWYACAVYYVGISLRNDQNQPRGWLFVQLTAAGSEGWTFWESYLRAFHHGLLTVIGEGVAGDTVEEVGLGTAGVLGGVLWLAYFTSNMVRA